MDRIPLTLREKRSERRFKLAWGALISAFMIAAIGYGYALLMIVEGH